MLAHHLRIRCIHGVEICHGLEENVDVYGMVKVGADSVEHHLEGLQDLLCLRCDIGSPPIALSLDRHRPCRRSRWVRLPWRCGSKDRWASANSVTSGSRHAMSWLHLRILQ